MDSNDKISKVDGPKRDQKKQVREEKLYRVLIGGFICMADALRLDLSFIV